MNLTIGVIIDGFFWYKPTLHKISDTNAQVRGLFTLLNFRLNKPLNEVVLLES
jgi:hypothetical protein